MEVIWSPTEEVRDRSNALRLARKLGFEDYADLVRFSQDQPETFWPALPRVVVPAVVLAVASWVLVERPALRWSARATRPPRRALRNREPVTAMR